MNTTQKIIIAVGLIVLTSSLLALRLFGLFSANHINKSNELKLPISVTPKPSLVATLSAKITNTYTNILSPTPSPFPTTDPIKIKECQDNRMDISIFSGLDCYKDVYDEEWKKWNKIHEENPSEISLDSLYREIENRASYGVAPLLDTNCLKIKIDDYKVCKESLNSNISRFRDEIRDKFSSNIKDCLTKVTDGNNNVSNKIKEFYWKKQMFNNIEKIFIFCSLNHGNLNDFHF